MGESASCSVCHFRARAVSEKWPRDQLSPPSVASRRVESDTPRCVKSRQKSLSLTRLMFMYSPIGPPAANGARSVPLWRVNRPQRVRPRRRSLGSTLALISPA